MLEGPTNSPARLFRPANKHFIPSVNISHTTKHVFTAIHFLLFQILTLHFVVLSFDRYSRDDVVGEVMLEMESLDLKDSEVNPLSVIREISPRSMKVF